MLSGLKKKESLDEIDQTTQFDELVSAYSTILQQSLTHLLIVTKHPKQLFAQSIAIMSSTYSISFDSFPQWKHDNETDIVEDKIEAIVRHVLDRHAVCIANTNPSSKINTNLLTKGNPVIKQLTQREGLFASLDRNTCKNIFILYRIFSIIISPFLSYCSALY